MKNDQKVRVLQCVLATLTKAVSNQPSVAGEPASGTLSMAQVQSALGIVQSVLKDDASDAASLTPTDIAQLILQILQLILSHLPTTTASPAADSSTSATDIAEIILQVLELILAKLGVPSGNTAKLSPVDIAGLILEVLQLLLSKFGGTTSTPAPAPSA